VAAEHNLLVISDEVYRELCFGAPPTALRCSLTKRARLLSRWRVFQRRTCCRAGAWVGCVFSNTEKMGDLINAITRLASGRLCSPTPAQYAVRPALTGGNEFLQSFVSEIKHRRDVAVSRVREIETLSCTTPEAAFYLNGQDG